ncbi:MAG: NAD-dependent deacylase [Myxococcales bacterium]|nr:NAD-dependent deacylase [Myxococcales bacterium]
MTTLRFSDFANVVFFTGAGMSAESGVPTYRGRGGIWKEYDYETYACQTAFDRDPRRVWEFHNYRRGLVAGCEPNAGHRLIAQLERERPGVVVVTQNIDGLHQRAGSRNVFELHGSLWRTRCERCGKREASDDAPLADVHCPCGAFKRPDIVWFGDMLSSDLLRAASEAMSHADLLVAIGTSASVYPAAELPRLAQRAGAVLVEINLEDTPLSDLYDHRLRGTASAILAELCDAATPAPGSAPH